MTLREIQGPHYVFALSAARDRIRQLLDLFPELQDEFTVTMLNGTGPVPIPSRKTESARARAKRLRYQKEYRERKKAEREGFTVRTRTHGMTAAARKKLSVAMRRRWAAAKAAGTSLVTGEALKTVATSETPKERKNRLQREWRANQKKKKGAK